MPRFLAVLAVFALAACHDDPAVDRAALGACAAGPTVRGIDVSKWQGAIAWDLVAGDGVKYAFVRTSHGLADVDPRFAFNWSEAKRVGILRGAYQYFVPTDSASEQAARLVEHMGPLDATDLPPVIDVESAGALSPSQLADAVQTWLDHVMSATGRRPIVYTSASFWASKLASSAAFVSHPLWVAHYGVSCPNIAEPWPRWDFWQRSATGMVAGITDNVVDLDDFNGDAAALSAFVAASSLCGDGACQPGERVADCAVDCAACALPADGGLIDDGSACFTRIGRASSWRSEAAGEEGSLSWTYAWDQPDQNIGTWTFELAEAGRYLVEVHTPAPWGGSAAASYHLRHGGVDDVVVLDQAAVDGWQSLGEHDFTSGGDQRLRLGDSTGEPLADQRQLVFDAIRLTRVLAPPDAGTPLDAGAPDATTASSEEDEAEDQGCAITPGHAAPGGLLLLLVLLGLTRRRA